MRDYSGMKYNDDFVQVVVASNEDSYESVGVLLVSSLETGEGWVMDSDFSYHMCPRKEYFETLKLEQGGEYCLVTIRLTMFIAFVRSEFKCSMIVSFFIT